MQLSSVKSHSPDKTQRRQGWHMSADSTLHKWRNFLLFQHYNHVILKVLEERVILAPPAVYSVAAGKKDNNCDGPWITHFDSEVHHNKCVRVALMFPLFLPPPPPGREQRWVVSHDRVRDAVGLGQLQVHVGRRLGCTGRSHGHVGWVTADIPTMHPGVTFTNLS